MTSFHDDEYTKLVNYVFNYGVRKPNRTGVDTIGVFSYQMRFNLRDGTIPLLTTKKVHTKSIIHELLWMMSGDSNIKYLKDNGVTIWDEWADENGDLGPVYGVQWRNWQQFQFVPAHAEGSEWVPDEHRVNHIDQIAVLVDKLKNNPLDRRLIVSAWNVADLPQMKLPPCHYAFQFYTRPLTLLERVRHASKTHYVPDDISEADLEQVFGVNGVPKYELSLMLNQRSCDIGLGVPFNIVQYSFILRMFCEVANMIPGEFIWNGGDTHVYVNHIDALKEQLARVAYPSPSFKFARKVADINDFKYEDFVIRGYESHPAIKMEVAV
jgi:thymidylate synthase